MHGMKRGRKKVEEDAEVKVEEESEAGKDSKRSPKLQRNHSTDDISAGVPIEVSLHYHNHSDFSGLQRLFSYSDYSGLKSIWRDTLRGYNV